MERKCRRVSPCPKEQTSRKGSVRELLVYEEESTFLLYLSNDLPGCGHWQSAVKLKGETKGRKIDTGDVETDRSRFSIFDSDLCECG